MSSLNKALFLLLLVALATETSCRAVPPYNPNSSLSLVTGSLGLQFCIGILQVQLLNGPVPGECCSALRTVQQISSTVGSPVACKLTHLAIITLSLGNNASSPSPSGNDATVDISADIQAACGVNLGFSLDANTACP